MTVLPLNRLCPGCKKVIQRSDFVQNEDGTLKLDQQGRVWCKACRERISN